MYDNKCYVRVRFTRLLTSVIDLCTVRLVKTNDVRYDCSPRAYNSIRAITVKKHTRSALLNIDFLVSISRYVYSSHCVCFLYIMFWRSPVSYEFYVGWKYVCAVFIA